MACNLVCQSKIAQWTNPVPRCNIVHNKGYTFVARDAQGMAKGRQADALEKNYSNNVGPMVHGSKRFPGEEPNRPEVMFFVVASVCCQTSCFPVLWALL